MGSHAPNLLQPRASVLVGVLIALVVLSLVVIGVVTASAQSGERSRVRLRGDRSMFAAQAAAEMAVKELMDNVDHDGDGAIGTISNDSNAGTDVVIGAARAWASKSVSGNTTTVNAHGRSDEETGARKVERVVLEGSGAPVEAASILLMVSNSASLDSQESARKSLMESWGYTVTPLSANESQAAYDAAIASASVVYVCETVLSGDISTKLTGKAIGVITEESSISDELGFSTSMTTFTGSSVDIVNTTHYITRTLASGPISMFTSGQPVRYLSGTLGGFTTLGEQESTNNPTLAVMERGDTLTTPTPGGTAAGRRVYLPFGNTNMDINALTSDGLTIMRRSIQWCVMPVAHYALDETSGSSAADSGSSGTHTGTRSGGTWTVSGKVGGAASFNGSTDSLQIANHEDFRVTSTFSVAGWVKAASWDPDSNWASIVLRKGDANPCNWQLCVTAGVVSMTLDDYDTYGIDGVTVLSTGTWHHVAGTWDGTTVRLYVNGVLDRTATHAAPIGTDTRAVYVGGRSGSTDVINGSVDDVRFYNRVLTPAEIAALAAGGRPKIIGWSVVAPQ